MENINTINLKIVEFFNQNEKIDELNKNFEKVIQSVKKVIVGRLKSEKNFTTVSIVAIDFSNHFISIKKEINEPNIKDIELDNLISLALDYIIIELKEKFPILSFEKQMMNFDTILFFYKNNKTKSVDFNLNDELDIEIKDFVDSNKTDISYYIDFIKNNFYQYVLNYVNDDKNKNRNFIQYQMPVYKLILGFDEKNLKKIKSGENYLGIQFLIELALNQLKNELSKINIKSLINSNKDEILVYK